MQEDLKSLLALQEKDRRIMEVQADIDALKPELEELDSELESIEQELANARKRAEEIAQQREQLEGKIESYRVMQERRRQKLEWVRGAKEASTLMAEIDLARSVLAKEEAEWLRSADGVQKAEALADEIEEKVKSVKEQQEPRRAEIAGKRKACEGRLKKAQADRAGSEGSVTRQWLHQYERIRRGRAPLAIYPLHGGACGHCFTNIPLHLRHQIAQSEGAATCEACGVLVYVDA